MIRRCCALLLLLPAAAAAQYIITTIAGGAPPITPAPAATAWYGAGDGVAADASGIYFTAARCLFKVDAAGTLTRLAGTGKPGFSGDGGPAVNAQSFLVYGAGIAVDAAGNVYFADLGRIRRISPSGSIATIAGSALRGFSGDGGPAVNARLDQPYGLAIDGKGNLFMVDDDRIRRVSPDGMITTVATQLAGGLGLAVDAQGNLFVAEPSPARVRKFAPDGSVTIVAGGGADTSGADGPATGVRLGYPTGVAIDPQGNLWIADYLGGRISMVTPSGVIHTAARGLLAPRHIAVDPHGNVVFMDGAGQLQEITPDGSVKLLSGKGVPGAAAGGSATAAQIGYPGDVAVDPQGNVFIADLDSRRVWKVTPAGIISAAAGTGVAGFSGDGGPATEAMLSGVAAVKCDRQGNLYIGDNNRVRKVSPDGTISTIAGNGTRASSGDGGPALNAAINAVSGLEVDSKGNLYIIEGVAPRIRKVTTDGTIQPFAGNGTSGFSGDGGPATGASLNFPQSVAADAQGNVFVADMNNQRVRKISPTGIITTVAGTGTPTSSALFNPAGVAVDAQGNLYIADKENYRIRKLSPDGTIVTIAGAPGTQAYSGDGGPALNAQLPGASRLAVDAGGNIYIADNIAFSVRRLQPTSETVLLSAVVDAASQRAMPLSPGKIVVLYGGGLGPSLLSAVVQNQPAGGADPTQAAGTTVAFNGIAAPVLYTSANQVAAIVPYGVTGAEAQVTVTYQGQSSRPFTVALAPAAPSLFTLNQTGGGAAAAINVADGSINTAASPAHPGEYVSLFATGEGPTTPAGTDGAITSAQLLRSPVARVTATVGGLPAVVQYAGTAPGLVSGLMQVNVRIPDGVPPGGYVPVVVSVGAAGSAEDAVWIAVAAPNEPRQ
jgi:trimeric autotransporter adhesin